MKVIIIVASLIMIAFGATEIWLGVNGILGHSESMPVVKGLAGIGNASVLLVLFFNRHRLRLW